ncbi:hypothetical protein GGU11DRAFT_686351 [Lentinula aff. detonsa]|nr:hypothetical protein GGU11DRAFT_686351 [Lentinula aff. detonsa]
MNPELFELDSVVQWPDSNNCTPFPGFTEKSALKPEVLTPPVRSLSFNVTCPFAHEESFSKSDSNDENYSNRFSVSTTFGPKADWHSHLPDITLVSLDSLAFYVHSHTLLAASENAFGSLLPTTSFDANLVIRVPESSAMLNIILRAVYHMPFSEYHSFEDLSGAVGLLPVYGVRPKSYILRDTHLYMLLLSYSPTLPLKVYTLAAKHDLEDLAVSTSSHLLSFNLSTLSDETAEAVGSEYLRRLFFLHIGRLDALKRLLLQPPSSHPPTDHCGASGQKALTRVWALASAYLAWDSRPDLSTNLLESTFAPLIKDLSCEICTENLNTRIKDLSFQWSQVKVRHHYCGLDSNVGSSFHH